MLAKDTMNQLNQTQGAGFQSQTLGTMRQSQGFGTMRQSQGFGTERKQEQVFGGEEVRDAQS